MIARWRRPEPDAWEARCGDLALLVAWDEECEWWDWRIVRGTWDRWDGYRDRRGSASQVWWAWCPDEEQAIREGLDALARAVRA